MSIEAMKQALEAWQTSVYGSEIHHKAMLLAMTKIGQAIEQAEKQEPVAVIRTWHKMGEQHAELWNWHTGLDALPDGEHTLYTTPQPQREWVGLTDEEIALACAESAASAHQHDDISFARAIEAKLKEKNG